MPRQFWRSDPFLVLLLSLALAVAIYWPVFSTDDLPGGELSDTVHQGYPFLSYTLSSLQEGRIPHWNPYIYCGIPFFSSFSAPVFYPVRGLLLLLAGAEASVRFLYPIQVVIAAISAWLFLGAIGVSRAGRLVGTAAFAAGAWANTLFYAGHGSKVISWSFLPLLLYACESWWLSRRFWFICLGGVALGMQALSSHPQMLLYSLIAASIWFCWRFFERPGVRPAAAALVGFTAMTIIGLALGAVQMLPGWNFSRVSTRGEDLPPDQAASYSLPPEESLVMAFPHLFGYRHGFPDSEAGGGPVYWGRLGLRLSSEFVGVSILLAALAAVFSRKAHRGMALAAIAIAGLLISWGGYGPVYDILYQVVPVFRKLRAPHMAAFLTTSGIALLAGPGFDVIAGDVKKKAVHWKAFAAFGALCLVLLAFCRPILASAQASWWNRSGASASAYPELVERRAELASRDLLGAALAAAGASAIACMLAWKKLSPGSASILFAGLALIELIPLDRDFQVYLPQSRIEDLNPSIPSLNEMVGEGRIFPGGNEFIPLRLRSVMGYHAARTQAVDAMLGAVSSGGLLQARSSAFTVFIDRGQVAPYETVAEMTVESFAGMDTTVQEIPRTPMEPMPRVFFAANWVIGDDSGSQDLRSGTTPEELSTLSADPGITRTAGSIQEADIATDEPELVEISTESDAAGILVLADTWHPRWIVSIDSERADLLEANGWMRAVAVPAGSHLVSFVYDSSDFRAGLLISIASALLVISAGILEILRRKKTGALGP